MARLPKILITVGGFILVALFQNFSSSEIGYLSYDPTDFERLNSVDIQSLPEGLKQKVTGYLEYGATSQSRFWSNESLIKANWNGQYNTVEVCKDGSDCKRLENLRGLYAGVNADIFSVALHEAGRSELDARIPIVHARKMGTTIVLYGVSSGKVPALVEIQANLKDGRLVPLNTRITKIIQ